MKSKGSGKGPKAALGATKETSSFEVDGPVILPIYHIVRCKNIWCDAICLAARTPVMSTIVNVSAVIFLSIIVLAFELGGMAPADAFFGAAFVMVGFTAYQFLRQDGQALPDAVKAIFTPKGGRALSFSYLAFIGCTVVSAIVVVQAVVVA